MRVDDIPGFADMTTEEKLVLLDDIWQSISAHSDTLPVLDSHKAELDARLERYNADPSCAISFEELQRRINHER